MDMNNIIVALRELKEDSSTPKNVKLKMEEIEKMLGNNGETSMNITKAIHMIEELSEDANLQQFTRAQLLNLVAILEMNL